MTKPTKKPAPKTDAKPPTEAEAFQEFADSYLGDRDPADPEDQLILLIDLKRAWEKHRRQLEDQRRRDGLT